MPKTDENPPAPVATGATGRDACPACGHAYDDHGQGGNCYLTARPRRVRTAGLLETIAHRELSRAISSYVAVSPKPKGK